MKIKEVKSLIHRHFRRRMKITCHQEEGVPLVIWRREQPWAFCDVSERTSSLKATPMPNIHKDRLERLYLARTRMMGLIGSRTRDLSLYSHKRPEYPVYPQVWKLLKARDGLWGCFLPTPEPDWGEDPSEEYVPIDPRWFNILTRSYGHAKPQPKPASRLAKKDLERRAYEKVQRVIL